jgi:hypothetical protein
MSSIFELEHVFVVFPPGGGGNFIAGLIAKLISNDFSNLNFSNSGNSHKNSILTPMAGDPFHCGLLYGLPKFNTVEEKISFYKKTIEEKYQEEYTIPMVGWTHDFTNIEVYRNIFPNCKILVVTQETNKEKLAVLIQQELKNRLDPAGLVFVDDTRYLKIWKTISYFFLNSILGNKYNNVIQEMLDNKFDPRYNSLVAYITINNMIQFFKFEFEQNITNKQNYINYLDYNLYYRLHNPEFDFTKPNQITFVIGPPYTDCIGNNCEILPYSCIMEKNTNLFVNKLESLFNSPFNKTQRQFLTSNFDLYFDKQIPELMQDPLLFFKTLEKKAMEQVNIIKSLY